MLENYNSLYRYWRYRRRYNIHPTARFLGRNIFISQGKSDNCFVFGMNSHIGDYSNFSLAGGNIIIGKNTSIGHDLYVTTNGFDTGEWVNGNVVDKTYGDVVIGDHVWIGHRCFIRGGVKIGCDVVIGYGSIVTRDVPDGCVYVGDKVIKERGVENIKHLHEALSLTQDGTWVESL